MIDLEKLKQLAEAATPGPWCFGQCGSGTYEVSSGLSGRFIYHPEVLRKLVSTIVSAGMSEDELTLGVENENDAEFIAAARTAVPQLIERIEELESQVRLTHAVKQGEIIEEQRKRIEKLEEALRKIYRYRSDKPDWNMVMAIAGDVIEPTVIFESKALNTEQSDK